MTLTIVYTRSIEDDILNLVDEIDIDAFLREAAASLDDPDKLSDFIREKTAIAIERFLVSQVHFVKQITEPNLSHNKFAYFRIICPKCRYLSKNEILLMDGS